MDFNTAPRIKSVEEYYFSKKLQEIASLRENGHDIINLAIGSPDLPPHQSVISSLMVAAENPANHGYQSYKGIPSLREAFSAWLKKYFDVAINSAQEILPLIGSKEGIMHIAMTYLSSGDQVLVPNPGYPTYLSASKLTGAEPVFYHLKEVNGYYPDFEELEKLASTKKVKMMWINYPHMPTGTDVSIPVMEELVRFAQKHSILLCHDNPYAFLLTEKQFSIFSIEGAKDVAIELHSLSKSHNMAGWRVGAMVAKKEILDEVIKFKSNMDSGMFKAIQLAASQALSLDEGWYQRLNQIYRDRKKLVLDLFEHLNCEAKSNQVGLFVWAKIPSDYAHAIEFTDELLYTKDVFITPGSIFGSEGSQYARISLCANEQIIKETINRIISVDQKNTL